MLFLAVFCGFIAENIREYSMDRKKEKEYILSMIEDLKADTTSLSKSINNYTALILGKDSMILLLNKEKWTNEEVLKLYRYHIFYVGYMDKVFLSKRTQAQLFNAGGLRLIKNQKASDAITHYITGIDFIEETEEKRSLAYSEKALDISATIMDNKYIRELPHEPYVLDSLALVSPVLLTTDRKEIKKFAFYLEQDKSYMIGLLVNLHTLKKRAIELIQLLKKEYHLE